jgi:hypothetical protein
MNREDLSYFSIITEDKLIATGANIDGLDFDMIMSFEKFSVELPLETSFEFVHNGLNSGTHQSPEHAQGKAGDFILINCRMPLIEIIARLTAYGFRAIGVYCNHKGIYSYHADKERWRQWACKIDENGNRKMFALINDPGKI